MMFAKLFRSRWSALVWAGGIVWSAADFADSAPVVAPPANAATGVDTKPQDATGEAVDPADLAVLANAIRSD